MTEPTEAPNADPNASPNTTTPSPDVTVGLGSVSGQVRAPVSASAASDNVLGQQVVQTEESEEKQVSEEKLTKWFPPTIKPVRVGLYNASMFRDETFYRWWDGKDWSYGDWSKVGALMKKKTKSKQGDTISWRGLTKEPK